MPKFGRAALAALFLTLTAFSLDKPLFAQTLDAQLLHAKWVVLSGDWDYYKSELLQPYEFYPAQKNNDGQKVKLPLKFEKDTRYGTFHYRVENLVPKKIYATEIYGTIVSSCRFWCNGKLVATSGFLSKDKNSAKPGDLCEPIDLLADSHGILDLVIHVADFENEERGILKPIRITEKRNAETMFQLNYFLNTMILFFLLAHILYNLTQLFINSKRQNQLLLIILFALLIGSVIMAGYSLSQRIFRDLPYISHRRIPVSLFCLEALVLVLYESSLYKLPRKRTFLPHAMMAVNAAAAFAASPAVFEKAKTIFAAIAILGVLFTVAIPTEVAFRRNAGSATSSRRNFFLTNARTFAVLVIILASVADFLVVPQTQTSIHAYHAYKLSILIFGITQCIVYAFDRSGTLARVNKYSQALAEENNTLARFVSEKILKLIGASDLTKIIPGECRIIESIIFCAQVKNYNQISESIDRKELFEIMTDFYQSISPIILDSGGFIAKYTTGGFIALFTQKNTDAIVCSARIQKKLKEIRRKLRKKNRTDIGVGISIHSGRAAVGTMGTNYRLDTVTISDDVALACAVANQTTKMNAQILITEEAMPYCRNYIDYMYEGHFFILEGKQTLVYSAMPIVKLETAYEETLEVIEDEDEL